KGSLERTLQKLGQVNLAPHKGHLGRKYYGTVQPPCFLAGRGQFFTIDSPPKKLPPKRKLQVVDE
uniref:Uncharacterized protein n=1 Tax=Leersia perrieri TaxID=77586 RepID=A0A0D9WBI0_9ORYZ